MSYDPNIILDKRDLVKKSNIIDNEYWDWEQQQFQKPKRRLSPKTEEKRRFRKEAITLLYNLGSREPIHFKKHQILIFEVEGSQSNRAVRDVLDELEIPYAVTY